MRISLTYELFDLNIVSNRLARLRQSPEKCHAGIQQTIGSPALDHVIDSQVGAEKQICLACLHRYAGRCAVAIQIPGPRKHIVFSDNPATAQRTFFTHKGYNPVHEHEGFVRQSHTGLVGINHFEFRAEYLGYGSCGKLQAVFSGINRGNSRGLSLPGSCRNCPGLVGLLYMNGQEFGLQGNGFLVVFRHPAGKFQERFVCCRGCLGIFLNRLHEFPRHLVWNAFILISRDGLCFEQGIGWLIHFRFSLK